MAGRTHDPLIRKAKMEAMSPDILAKNTQLLIEKQLRLVWRLNEIKPHMTEEEKARTDDTGAHPHKNDILSVNLLFLLWERYRKLDAMDEPDQTAINSCMTQICRLTSELETTKNTAFQQMLQVVEHNRKMQEHADNLKMQAAKMQMDPDSMGLDDLTALAEEHSPTAIDPPPEPDKPA